VIRFLPSVNSIPSLSRYTPFFILLTFLRRLRPDTLLLPSFAVHILATLFSLLIRISRKTFLLSPHLVVSIYPIASRFYLPVSLSLIYPPISSFPSLYNLCPVRNPINLLLSSTLSRFALFLLFLSLYIVVPAILLSLSLSFLSSLSISLFNVVYIFVSVRN